METIVVILSGIMIALTSGIIGKAIGTTSKVNEAICNERQLSCQSLINEKLDNICEKVELLTKVVNGKLLGL